MRSNRKLIEYGCPEWRDEIADILQADIGSEIRASWERHSLSCRECTRLIEEDLNVIRHIQELPTPAHADISAAVMEHIHQPGKSRLVIRPQHIAWGFSSAVVGFFLGFLISGLTLEPSVAASADDNFEQTFSEFNTGIDSLVNALVEYDEKDTDE